MPTLFRLAELTATEARGEIVPAVPVWTMLASAWSRLAGEGAEARFGDLDIAPPVAIEEIAPSGVAAGDPKLGDAASGERAVAWLADGLVQLIQHLSDQP